jgi:hypothetical protein
MKIGSWRQFRSGITFEWILLQQSIVQDKDEKHER